MTNLPDAPEAVYTFYCGRGDVENRLKELHHGLELDRTSCQHFLPNQFRLLLTLAAYVLFQELRRRAAGTACADAQVTTLRERLLKLAVWVERSTRRIVLHLPVAFPWLPTWHRIAPAVGRHALTASMSPRPVTPRAHYQYRHGRGPFCYVHPARRWAPKHCVAQLATPPGCRALLHTRLRPVVALRAVATVRS